MAHPKISRKARSPEYIVPSRSRRRPGCAARPRSKQDAPVTGRARRPGSVGPARSARRRTAGTTAPRSPPARAPARRARRSRLCASTQSVNFRGRCTRCGRRTRTSCSRPLRRPRDVPGWARSRGRTPDRDLVVDRRRQHAVTQGEDAEDRLERAGRAEAVARWRPSSTRSASRAPSPRRARASASSSPRSRRAASPSRGR